MLQVKYKNDGECQRYGTLTFRIYAAEDTLTNIYFKLNAPDFFRGCIKERCIFLPYIGAGEYSEFSIPFRSMRGFNSLQITFALDVQCTIKRGGISSSICWNGSFIRNFAVEKAPVQHTTYHIENKTTLNASENAIAYAGGTSNDYSGFSAGNGSTPEIDFSVVPGSCRPAAVPCDEFLLVKIDTGKDLERGVRNELTICFDPCYRVGLGRNFSMKKIAGTLSVSGKTQIFYADKFFTVEQFVGGYRYERYYCRIPVVLPENVPQLDLCQLTCSGEMNGQSFCLSMPQNIACTLLAPREPEFSEIEDLGKLSMLFEENAEELFHHAEQIENPEMRKNLYMRALPTAPETIHREILNKIGKSSYSYLDFSETGNNENISVLHLISCMDAYKEEKKELQRETEFQKACRLFGKFGNGLNPEYAYDIFLKEYEAGNENSVAATRLAECYILGIGTAQDFSKGVELMRHAADAGNPEAMLNYSECCFAGIGILKNIDAGKKYLLAAANTGNPEAMCKLAGLYFAGKFFSRNYEEAKRLYIQANTIDAKFSLACMKYFGLAEERNIPAAVEWFAELSNQGHVPSKIMYVNCLANGIGIEQNIAKADAICAEIPEESGVMNGLACKNAAMMNFRQKNYNKAVELLQKAVKNQNAEAAFILAQQCYTDGVGVLRNGVIAVELLKWASRKNHKKSQLQLAENWLRGIGVYQDYSKAMEILKKFDGSNDPRYLFLMGMCQYHGLGIAEDEAAGLRLLKRSADAGYPPAAEYLEDIEL